MITRAASRNRGLLLVLIFALAIPAGMASTAEPVPPGNATWHIGLVDLWGQTGRGESRRLDIYPVFEDGKWAQALATSRRYNTSVHFVQRSTVQVDGKDVTGELTVLVTPDAWIPKDGKPYRVEVEIDGKLVLAEDGSQYSLTGRYEAKMPDGKVVRDKLIGGAGATETGWDDSSWSVELTPMVLQGEAPLPLVKLSLGVADGKVQWCTVGRSYRGPAPRRVRLDVSTLRYDGDTVSGTVEAPAEAMNVTIDPDAVAEVKLTVHRVQGLVGGRAEIAYLLDGKPLAPSRHAYGRGSGSKGGGKRREDAAQPLWRYRLSGAPWCTPIEGFDPPQPGEHPRLLFREEDLETLREKAKTPTGKAILKRLRYLLDGKDGETMTDVFSDATHAYMGGGHRNKVVNKPGVYTISHAAGYGLLYQLTGEQKYADFGRKCFEKAFAGVRDRDDRYSWKKPGGALRAGTSLGWYAVGYDLCCDGWDPAFRKKVARAIQGYDENGGDGDGMSFPELVRGISMPPVSNHWGMMVGGGALAALAIMDDPGVDMRRVGALVDDSVKSMIRLQRYGWGDHGFFAEGDGTGSMSAHIAYLPALQAWRNAGGKDFISSRPNARWMTLKWVLLSVGRGGHIWFPTRGGYGHNVWSRRGISGAGYFAEGMASVLPEQVPGLLWFYNRYLGDHDAQRGTPYDTPSAYPHHSVLSFVNWPLDVKPVNPAESVPKAAADTVYNHFMARNRWKDERDIVVSFLLGGGPEGYIDVDGQGTLRVRAYGRDIRWKTNLGYATPTYYDKKDDGSFVFSAVHGGKLSSFAVDFGGRSGADALLVGAGPAFGRRKPRLPDEGGAAFTRLKAGGNTFDVLTIQEGEAPEVSTAAGAVEVGKRTVRFDGKKLILK